MTRPEQLPEYLRNVIGAFLARDVDVPDDVLATVARVDVDAGRESAAVWISILPAERGEETLALIRERLYDLQGTVNAAVPAHAPRLSLHLVAPGSSRVMGADALLRDLHDDPHT